MSEQKIPNIISQTHTPSIDIGERQEIARVHFEKTGVQFWDNQPLLQDKERSLEDHAFWMSHLKSGDPPCFQVAVGNYGIYTDASQKDWRLSLADYSLNDFDLMVFGIIGGISPTAANPNWATKRYIRCRNCPACGNKPVNTLLPKDFIFSKIPKKKSLLYFYPPHLHFARQQFIDTYEASGLTGLSFEPVTEDLFWVKIAFHRWDDRTGVCEECGMKTNVVGQGFFNLPEKYLYDIQRVETNTCDGYSPFIEPSFVLSRRAARFFKKDIRNCDIPILPNYLSDLVWPAPRMFTNGTYPTTVYREK